MDSTMVNFAKGALTSSSTLQFGKAVAGTILGQKKCAEEESSNGDWMLIQLDSRFEFMVSSIVAEALVVYDLTRTFFLLIATLLTGFNDTAAEYLIRSAGATLMDLCILPLSVVGVLWPEASVQLSKYTILAGVGFLYHRNSENRERISRAVTGVFEDVTEAISARLGDGATTSQRKFVHAASGVADDAYDDVSNIFGQIKAAILGIFGRSPD